MTKVRAIHSGPATPVGRAQAEEPAPAQLSVSAIGSAPPALGLRHRRSRTRAEASPAAAPAGRRRRWLRVTRALAAGLLCVAAAACSSSGGGGGDDEAGDGGEAGVDDTTTVEAVPEPDFASMSESELATQAYVAGYPLVVSMRTMQRLGGLIGVNTMFWQNQVGAGNRGVIVAPNRDTIYSLAVLDLRSEPMAITLPEVTDRYYTYQFLDAWTETFDYVGTRATGGRAGTWVVTPPGWEGELPDGAEQIGASTPLVFLLGRYLVQDEADAANIAPIRDQAKLQPLSTLAGTPAPAAPPALGTEKGTAQDIPADAAFFDELGDALAINEPATDLQRELFTQVDALGVGAGKHPATDAALGADTALLAEGAVAGSQQIEGNITAFGDSTNGWVSNPEIGVYGDDLLLRATVAKVAFGANVGEEALYPIARQDSTGAPLNGNKTYTITFPAGALPPAEEFWSITPYGPDMFLVDHPSDRYTIGDRTPGLTFEDDGSLVLTLSHDEPATGAGNWLPVPEGDFVLILRLYLPTEAALDGSYAYPGIVPAA
jgi:hypothetical protein